MLKANETVAIGWIDAGTVHTSFAGSVCRLLLNSNSRITDVITASGPYLSFNRNDMVRRFLTQTKADWLMMFDSDIVVSPDDFSVLCNSADSKKAPIMSGKYFLAGMDGTVLLAAQVFKEDGKTEWMHDYEDNKVYSDLHSVGDGYVLIHRSVFELVASVVPDNPYPWFQDYWDGSTWMSEDVYFFNQCRALGIPIAINTGAQSRHLKTFGVTDSTYVKAKKFEEARGKALQHYAHHKRSWWHTWRGTK